MREPSWPPGVPRGKLVVMDSNTLHLIVSAGLTLLCVVIVALIWTRAKWRTIVWWLGLAMIPIAVWLLGLAPLVADGGDSLVGWYQGVTWDPLALTGASLVGLGVLLMLISRVMPARPRQRRVKATAPAPQVTDRPRPAYDSSAGSATTSGATASSQLTVPEDEDVTDILKRRGIN